jgi:Spy/CpxP family protein refolding chaperone
MRHALVFTLGVVLIAMSAMALTSARQILPAPAPSAASVDASLREIRADLQNTRADVMAKNVSLTSEQAAKFWPVFEAYQKEQNLIMDDQLKAVQWYVQNFEGADDAAALALMNAHFDRDTRMNTLRQKWLGEFQKVVGTKLAVRVMQIDRRLSLAHQAYLTSNIPLAH